MKQITRCLEKKSRGVHYADTLECGGSDGNEASGYTHKKGRCDTLTRVLVGRVSAGRRACDSNRGTTRCTRDGGGGSAGGDNGRGDRGGGVG